MFKVGLILCSALTLTMAGNVVADSAPSGKNVPSKSEQSSMTRKNEKARDLNRKSERDEKSEVRKENMGENSGHSLAQENEAS